MQDQYHATTQADVTYFTTGGMGLVPYVAAAIYLGMVAYYFGSVALAKRHSEQAEDDIKSSKWGVMLSPPICGLIWLWMGTLHEKTPENSTILNLIFFVMLPFFVVIIKAITYGALKASRLLRRSVKSTHRLG